MPIVGYNVRHVTNILFDWLEVYFLYGVLLFYTFSTRIAVNGSLLFLPESFDIFKQFMQFMQNVILELV